MRIDGTRGISVGFTVHRQVTVARHGDPFGSREGVVVDRLAVGV